jgi:hypothetical protein
MIKKSVDEDANQDALRSKAPKEARIMGEDPATAEIRALSTTAEHQALQEDFSVDSRR